MKVSSPAVRRAHEWLILAHTFGLAVILFATRPERSWASMDTLMRVIHEGAVFVDVRSPYLYQSKTIPGARNIPERDLEFRAEDELSKDVPVVVFGGIGNDSAASYRFLREHGYDVYDLGPYSRLPHGFEHHLQHQH